MSATILFSTDYVTIEYNPDHKIIHHVIHQPIGGQVEMLKEALNAGTQALAEQGICKWLSDDRNNGPLPQELVEWGSTDWNLRTIQAGWKYWANVVPHEVVAAGSLTPVIDALSKHGLMMRLFTTAEDALAWLDRMPNE